MEQRLILGLAARANASGGVRGACLVVGVGGVESGNDARLHRDSHMMHTQPQSQRQSKEVRSLVQGGNAELKTKR